MRVVILSCLLWFGGLVGALKAQSVPDIYAKIRLAGFEAPIELRRSGQKTRIDLNAGGVLQTYIADKEKGILISLTATGTKRLALVFPLDQGQGLLPLPLDVGIVQATGVLKPVGSSLLAGEPCRLMEFSRYLNQSGVLCVSADGLILQMTQRGRNAPLFQVSSLTRGAQDVKWFVIPADYQTIALPAIGGAAGPLTLQEPLEKPAGTSKSPFR